MININGNANGEEADNQIESIKNAEKKKKKKKNKNKKKHHNANNNEEVNGDGQTLKERFSTRNLNKNTSEDRDFTPLKDKLGQSFFED
jgi:hypothetical protein